MRSIWQCGTTLERYAEHRRKASRCDTFCPEIKDNILRWWPMQWEMKGKKPFQLQTTFI